MPFPLPSPDELIRRQETVMEEAVRAARPDVSPEAIARAVRSPRGLLAAICRVNAMALYEAHLHLAWNGRQLLPDTAETDILIRHASHWGIFQRPATRAVGSVVFSGSAGVVVPAGLDLRLPAGGVATTTAAGTIGGTGSLTLAVEAAEPGPEGNAAAGSSLGLVSPVLGLSTQTAEVDAGGIAGGADIETGSQLLARLLERIRRPPAGGAAHDYPVWISNAFAVAKVRTVPHVYGVGTVGVVVATGSAEAPTAPNPTLVAAMAEELERRRPVTAAEIHVLPAVLTPQPLSLAVSPDSAAVRAAVTAAHVDFFAREAEIGWTLRRSRLSEALSAAAGEYAHWIVAPTEDVIAPPTTLLTPGTITWVAP